VTEIGGKYKIESSLGRGAFGVVYKCINKETGDIVAVKTLRRANESN
jgi:serine/threonine protein kinase